MASGGPDSETDTDIENNSTYDEEEEEEYEEYSHSAEDEDLHLDFPDAHLGLENEENEECGSTPVDCALLTDGDEGLQQEDAAITEAVKTETEAATETSTKAAESKAITANAADKSKGIRRQIIFPRGMSMTVLRIISKAQYASLLNDFVESEFFVIDGDSLMIEYTEELTIYPGQMLHFFYLVECFLVDLMQRGAKFVIVFFQDAEHLWSKNISVLFLRTALILHLQHNTDISVYTEFPNFLSSEWQLFVKENYPYFIMMSDQGMQMEQESLSEVYFQMFISHTLGKGINVALTSGQTFDALRVYGYHIQSNYYVRRFIKQHEEQMKAVYENFIQRLSRPSSMTYRCLLLNIEEKICQTSCQLQNLWPKGSDIRRVVCVVSCSVVLQLYQSSLELEETPEKPTESKSEHDNKQMSEALSFEEAVDLCKIYCLHEVLLLLLPLSERAQTKMQVGKWEENVGKLFSMRRHCEYFALKQLGSVSDWKVDLTHLSDLSDRLLFNNVALYWETQKATESNIQLSEEIEKEYRHLWDTVSELVGRCDVGEAFPVRNTSRVFIHPEETLTNEHREKILNIGLIPIRSSLLEEYAGDVLKDLPHLNNDNPIVMSLSKSKEFDELIHWHTMRPLSDDYDRTKSDGAKPKDPKEVRKRLRDNQKYSSFLRFYGQSLEGNISKRIGTKEKENTPTKHESTVKKTKPSMQKGKAEIIVEANMKKKQAEKEQKEKETWKYLSANIEKEIKENIDSGLQNLQNILKTYSSDSVRFSAEMMAVGACFKVWDTLCSSTEKEKDLNVAIQIMRRIHIIMDKYQELLQKKEMEKIAGYLRDLGFDNLAMSALGCSQLQKQGSDTGLVNDSKTAVGIGAARFQLQHMGHYLMREERKDPDSRVQHFIPDTWQRELLDVVDNNESAVIVAPTSSGKTYASYYCMEKVMRDSNDGIVVYVAPTKALVNQVVATVHNRFIKDLPNGMTVCGVFTRDYRRDALNCQILVTVPQCLEILLLAPHRQNWAKRIKYVIFDEVHCLGGEIGAEVWEHLLVMIRCPFLALSATISNPEDLTEWLQTVKSYWVQAETLENSSSSRTAKSSRKKKEQQKNPAEKKSFKVRLVKYGERYNDLEKYVCTPNDGGFDFIHYHPCAALTVNHIEKYDIPSDLSLSPRECIKLYDTMVNVWQEWPRAKELDPEEFTCFKNKVIITRTDVRRYEEELKKELVNWVKCDHKKEAGKALQSLKPEINDVSEHDLTDLFPSFVEELRKIEALPALFFIFSIHNVEGFAGNVLSHLEKKEEQKKPDTKEIASLQNKLEKLEKLADRQTSLHNKLGKLKKHADKESVSDLKLPASKADALMVLQAEKEGLQSKLEMLERIPPDCTYANEKAVTKENLEEIFQKTKMNFSHFRNLRCVLERGIGYHHGSLKPKARQAVETLFRLGFLQVVTATGSLALGINMPCKSVVFAEDSVYLDALNLRQMSGRAGRRGHDLLGKVFFYNIPLPKVQRLIKANVPDLKGQFPLSISLVLRLMLLADKADDKTDAKAKALAVLRYSMMAFNQPKKQEMLKLYFLFSLQFFVREGYLDQEGTPQGFSGLAIHLHYHEPSNFLLISFLEKGLFHKLCKKTSSEKNDVKLFSEDVMETLVLVLANLFGVRRLPSRAIKLKGTFEQSKVFLEDLPEDFAAAAEEYNNTVQKIFGSFLLSVSKLADMEQEYQLPLSRISFAGTESFKETSFVSDLINCNDETTAVSPFATLSGNTNDDLLDTSKVDTILLRTVEVNTCNIPVFHIENCDRQVRRMPLNSYALDFYKHGSLVALSKDNFLTRGDAFQVIKEFSLVISSISTSLTELCEDENDSVVLAFQQLNKSYKEKYERIQN